MLQLKSLSLLFVTSSLSLSYAASKQCYSLDGQKLGSSYQPCNPDAAVSACCALNGTSSENDICLDTGLCQSTSGWFAGFIYADGCTDIDGTAAACPGICSHMPSQYNFNVLQCNPGVFCCRAGYDTSNCCNDTSALVNTSHIGSLLQTNGNVINTTFVGEKVSSCAANHTAAVGGALGGVLAAVIIGFAILLFFMLRQRRSLRKSLQSEKDARAAEHYQHDEQQKAMQQNMTMLKQDYLYNQPQSNAFGGSPTPTPPYQPPQQYPQQQHQYANQPLPPLPPPVEMSQAQQLSELGGDERPRTERGESELST